MSGKFKNHQKNLKTEKSTKATKPRKQLHPIKQSKPVNPAKSAKTAGKQKLSKNMPMPQEQVFYYMTQKEVHVDMLYEALCESTSWGEHTEVWTHAEVLEITTGEKAGIYMEREEPFEDEEDCGFVEEHHIETVYSVTVENGEPDTVKEIFRVITDRLGGFLCSDTDDFMPVIVGTVEK